METLIKRKAEINKLLEEIENLEEQTMVSIAKHEALFTEFRIINQQITRINSKK